MRSSNLIACLSIAGLLIIHATAASAPRTPDERTLERLSVEWMTALEKKDRKSLEAFLADDYVLQMPGDTASQFVRRKEWLTNAIEMDWTDLRYENVAAHVHGDHAMVSSRLHFRVSPFPFAFDSGVVDIWERRGGNWQVTARYLGDSKVQQRIAFILGLLTAGLAAGGLCSCTTGSMVTQAWKTVRHDSRQDDDRPMQPPPLFSFLQAGFRPLGPDNSIKPKPLRGTA